MKATIKKILHTPNGERVKFPTFGAPIVGELTEIDMSEDLKKSEQETQKKQLNEIKKLTWKKIEANKWITETSFIRASITKTTKYKMFGKKENYLIVYYINGLSKYKFKFLAPTINIIKQWFKKTMKHLTETTAWSPSAGINRGKLK